MSKLVVLKVEAGAPDKPALGASCNGCGVCCLAEPCPLGVLLSRRRTGACVAVVWSAEQSRYLCGALTEPARFAGPAAPILARVAGRWIAAGIGCDSDVELDTDEG